MKTLLLDLDDWDLVIDAKGDIALASDPYAPAQDAASAIKLFEGDLYYDTIPGVPYWGQILGLAPTINYMRAKFVAAALTVPGVATAKCFLRSIVNREVRGQVQITTDSGETATASF